MGRHVNYPNELSLVGDPDRFAKAANLLTLTLTLTMTLAAKIGISGVAPA